MPIELTVVGVHAKSTGKYLFNFGISYTPVNDTNIVIFFLNQCDFVLARDNYVDFRFRVSIYPYIYSVYFYIKNLVDSGTFLQH